MDKFLKNLGYFISISCLVCVGYYVYQYNSLSSIIINDENKILFFVLLLFVILNSILSIIFIFKINKLESSLFDIIDHIDNVEDNLACCNRDTQQMVIDVLDEIRESKGKIYEKEYTIEQKH